MPADQVRRGRLHVGNDPPTEYKCSWYGRAFVKVGRLYPSSKTCSACGQVNQKVVLGVES
ncbi:MAG: zinc ribbon domain-containing protein [Coriobacteriaceae bacterium]